ncbi:hypothetical protein, partial [Paraburkholderia sp.]|uniref:hypothetical protein n=1 Tax=Paraburkholderia sp. TaxID=1926495 RepID=UPI0025EAAEDF
RIARVKVGNRQAPYPAKPRPSKAGVFAFVPSLWNGRGCTAAVKAVTQSEPLKVNCQNSNTHAKAVPEDGFCIFKLRTTAKN